MTYRVAKMQLNYEKAKVEHRTCDGDSNDSEPIQAIGRHAHKGKQNAEFKSEDSTDVTAGKF